MAHDVLPPDCFFSLSLSLPYLLYRSIEKRSISSRSYREDRAVQIPLLPPRRSPYNTAVQPFIRVRNPGRLRAAKVKWYPKVSHTNGSKLTPIERVWIFLTRAWKDNKS